MVSAGSLLPHRGVLLTGRNSFALPLRELAGVRRQLSRPWSLQALSRALESSMRQGQGRGLFLASSGQGACATLSKDGWP